MVCEIVGRGYADDARTNDHSRRHSWAVVIKTFPIDEILRIASSHDRGSVMALGSASMTLSRNCPAIGSREEAEPYSGRVPGGGPHHVRGTYLPTFEARASTSHRAPS